MVAAPDKCTFFDRVDKPTHGFVVADLDGLPQIWRKELEPRTGD